MIKLFLVDDDANSTQSLLDFESNEFEISIIGSAKSSIDTLRQLRSKDIDIVLLNIISPEMSGVDFCYQIKEEFPNVKIIVLTDEINNDILLKIWLQKTDAIFSKKIEKKELVDVIVRVMEGQKVIDKNIPCFFDNNKPESGNIPHLTKTEVEVLKLLGSGLSRKEAAHKMNRS